MILIANSETLTCPRMKPVEGEEVKQRSKVFQGIKVSGKIKV
jgi:hypothetical protein